MRKEDALPWLQGLEVRLRNLKGVQPGLTTGAQIVRNEADARDVATEVETALRGIFPASHPCITRWLEIVGRHISGDWFSSYLQGSGAAGIVASAIRIIDEGHLGTLLDAVRAASESELLDQAEQLLTQDYRAATAVIAGGALESRLKRYIAAKGLTITGDGSISKYNGAVGQARSGDPTAYYSANDGKQVEAWGGIRNEAAHSPGTFARSKEEVGRMISGIREFLARLG